MGFCHFCTWKLVLPTLGVSMTNSNMSPFFGTVYHRAAGDFVQARAVKQCFSCDIGLQTVWQQTHKTWNPISSLHISLCPSCPSVSSSHSFSVSHMHTSRKCTWEIEQERQAFGGFVWQGCAFLPTACLGRSDHLVYFLSIFLIYKSN